MVPGLPQDAIALRAGSHGTWRRVFRGPRRSAPCQASRSAGGDSRDDCRLLRSLGPHTLDEPRVASCWWRANGRSRDKARSRIETDGEGPLATSAAPRSDPRDRPRDRDRLLRPPLPCIETVRRHYALAPGRVCPSAPFVEASAPPL